MMKHFWIKLSIGLLLLLIVMQASVVAQVPVPVVPANRLAWDQPAPDLATAQSYQYALYVDNNPQKIILTATCTVGTIPFCISALPAMTPGVHTLELTAAELVGTTAVVESVRSVPLVIRVVIAPMAPTNPRIVP